MTKITSLSTIAGAFASLTFLGAGPALAGSPVTFVSGRGADGGTCADPAHPCHSFQFAHDQTSAGGEIKALDPAHYGRVTIDKSISITGVEGAGRTLNIATDAITINAGASDTVNLSHLILDGVKTAGSGIVLNSGGSLTITGCVVRNFTGVGIRIAPTGQTTFLITDTVASGNVFGISHSRASPQGTLDHVSMINNSAGIEVAGSSKVLAVDSTAANNSTTGFFVRSGSVLRLAHSVVTGNGVGVSLEPVGATAISAGNNVIRGNDTDVRGTLINAGTK